MHEKFDKVYKHPPLVARKSQNIVKENARNIYKSPGGLIYAIVWIAYVLLGSWIFLVLENGTKEVTVEHPVWMRFKNLYISREGTEELIHVRNHLSKLCPHELFNESFENPASALSKDSVVSDEGGNGAESQIANMHKIFEEIEILCESTLLSLQQIPIYTKWTMIDAIYYTMTLVTTIGFGHISPTTDKGKIFCILYALVGVPLTCILMARNSNWLSTKMLVIYQSAKKRINANQKTVLWIVTWMYFSVGFIVFMVIPSILFSYIEEWSFVDAIYFTFITLTTIGFGDFIAGYTKEMQYSSYYKIFIVVWIMISLGYWVMCLSFLQKAIKQNAKNLRKTFRKKTISKHTDLIKQLLSKLKSEPDESTNITRQKAHMMAILLESMSKEDSVVYNDSYESLNESGSSIKTPVLLRKTNDPIDNCDEDMDKNRVVSTSSSIEVPFSLDDLLNTTVVMQKEHLPGIDSLVSRVSFDFPPPPDTSIMPSQSINCNSKDAPSIELTVREVMGLSLLLSSMVNGSDTSDTDSHSDATDTLTSVVVYPREKMPLLKDILHLDNYQNEDSQINCNPKLQTNFFLDSQASFSGDHDENSYRQSEVATG